MQIQIREITVADTRLLTGLIKRLLVNDKDKWIGAIVTPSGAPVEGAETPDNEMEMAVRMGKVFGLIVERLFELFEIDLTAWFASLTGVTVEEYLALPADTDMVVVEQIKNSKEFSSFFTRACALYNIRLKFESLLNVAKEKLSSMTA